MNKSYLLNILLVIFVSLLVTVFYFKKQPQILAAGGMGWDKLL